MATAVSARTWALSGTLIVLFLLWIGVAEHRTELRGAADLADDAADLSSRGAEDAVGIEWHPVKPSRTLAAPKTTTLRAWLPGGGVTLVEVPPRRTRRKMRQSSATTTSAAKPIVATPGGKGWIGTPNPATLLPTETPEPTEPPTPTLTPTFYPTASIEPGSATIRVTLKFEDKTPLPQGAQLEVLAGGTKGAVIGDGVVSDFGLPNGTFSLVVRDSGIYQLLQPPVSVPRNPGGLIERTFTVPTAILRGSVKGTLGEPISGAILNGYVCPAWLGSCPLGGVPIAAVSGQNGVFRARVSPGFVSDLVVRPRQKDSLYIKTQLANRNLSTNVNVQIVLQKGHLVSGRVRRGDGMAGARSGSEMFLTFLPESYQGHPDYFSELKFRVDSNETFRAILPPDAYAVFASESGGVLDSRSELLIPRLTVRKDATIGPFMLRYGKLRIRLIDGATRKPPVSGEFSVTVTDRGGTANSATAIGAPGWNGMMGFLVSAPGPVTVDVAAPEPWVNPGRITSLLVGGVTTTVHSWIPVTHNIHGTLTSSKGRSLSDIPSNAIFAARISDPLAAHPFAANTSIPGKYSIAVPPGSYKIFLIPNFLSSGWFSYLSGSSYELRRGVAMGTVKDARLDLVVPSYLIQVVTVDAKGRPRIVSGNLAALFVLPGGNETQCNFYVSDDSSLGRARLMALAGRYRDVVFYAFESLNVPFAYAPVIIPDFELARDRTITVVLATPRIAVISGTLLLASGARCKGCSVCASAGDIQFIKTTDNAGRFTLEVRAGSRYNFTATANLTDAAGAPVIPDFVLATNVTVLKDTSMTFKLPGAVTYTGIVLDAGGKPISTALVAISGESGSSFQEKTGANGRFRFVGLPAPVFPVARVSVHVSNLLDQRDYSVDFGTRKITDGVVDRLVIPPRVTLSGQISNGMALKGLILWATSENGLDEKGLHIPLPTSKYSFDLLAGNNYRIVADLTTVGSRCIKVGLLANVTTRPGAPITKDLKAPLAVWKGTVTTSKKRALAGYTVRVESASWGLTTASCQGAMVTDSSGNFKLFVIPDNYTISIYGPVGSSWAPVVVEKQVVGAEGLTRNYVFTR